MRGKRGRAYRSAPFSGRSRPEGESWRQVREAARLPVRTNTRDRVRKYIGQYGLIAVLLIMPVAFGLQDLADDGNLTRLGNNLVAGLSNGAIWALIALGYTLVYGIIELINFAHGEVFMIGSLVTAAWFWGVIGLTEATATVALIVGLLASLIVAMLTSGALNVMIERVAYRPLEIGAEAGAADHGGRHVVHPPERRHPVDRRLAGGRARARRPAEGALHDRRRGHPPG